MMDEENSVDVETTFESYNEPETDSAERKPRSRERGPDKKPRTYRANSMRNFVQFKERPEEFAKYLKDEKGVNIDGNSGIVKAFLIFVGVVIAIFGGLWLYNHYKNRNDNTPEGIC
ncbi:hypothetical protein [Nitrosopumilus sp.]|uniref:hypothetical protein n=1 Tax=Nitrosopumilus sp. TaxID=2024843 RepID=UPI003B5C733A